LNKSDKRLAVLGIIMIGFISLIPIFNSNQLTQSDPSENSWTFPYTVSSDFNHSYLGRTMHNIDLLGNLPNLVFYSPGNSSGNDFIFYSDRSPNWHIKNLILDEFNLTDATLDHEKPAIVIDSRNIIHIVWRGIDQSSDKDYEIFYSKYQNGFWLNPINVSSNRVDDYFPDIEVDNSNNLHVSWLMENDSNYDLVYFMGKPTRWIINETVYYGISSETAIKGISLAISDYGRVAISFTRESTSPISGYEIIVFERIAGSWVYYQFVENLSNLFSPKIKYDLQNYLHLLYLHYNYSSYDNGIFYSFKNNDNWTIPLNLSLSNKEMDYGSFDIDVNGRVHIAYSQKDGSILNDFEIFYVNNTRGNFSQAVNITNNDFNEYIPSFKLDNSGYGHIVYYYLNGSNDFVGYIRSLNSLAIFNITPLVVIIIAVICLIVIVIYGVYRLKVRK
jgi:hypothetical protein